MMRKLFSTVVQFAGFGCIVGAAFMVAPVAGVALLGVALTYIGHKTEGG